MTAASEIDFLVRTLWGECRGEPWIGQVAVACVIRNRKQSDRWWPDTYQAVVTQRKQFSCWNGTEPTLVLGPMSEQLKHIAEGIFENLIPDITHGANHYINAFAAPREPSWAQRTKQVTLWPSTFVGIHTFYKL